MLMEQLGCTPAEAQRQLARLARESGISATELAAQITRQEPPGRAPEPRAHQVSLAGAAVETAASGSAVASALLSEALAPLGAAAVAIWLTEPDGGMALIGEARFGHPQGRPRAAPAPGHALVAAAGGARGARALGAGGAARR